MKIAIVGTGISGLVAAHHLHRRHEITVYEAAARIGGHTHTVTVPEPGGPDQAIDTGFIVFNDRNYPNFEALLDELGVGFKPSHMSFSVSDGRGGFEYSGTPWGLFARPSHLLSPSFIRMLREWRRFNRLAPGLIGMNGTAPSLGAWLEREGFSRHFIDRLIVPQASAVWSADPGQMWAFPASFMAEFFDNHGMYSLRDRPRWRTVEGGSRSYVEAITAPWRDHVRTAAPVRRIERRPDEVRIEADGCETESFDRVVIAAHSDQALAMLGDPTEAERVRALSLPGQLSFLRMRRGLKPQPVSVEEALAYDFSPAEEEFIAARNARQAIGTPDQVKARLDSLIASTGVDELMVSSGAATVEGRIRSLDVVAELYPAA